MTNRIAGYKPDNINFTLLLIISFAIIIALMLVMTIVWNKYLNNKDNRESKNIDIANRAQKLNNEKFVLEKIEDIVQAYKIELAERDHTREIVEYSHINSRLKSMISDLVKSNKFKWVLENSDGQLFNKATLLVELLDTKPTLWDKKYKDKLEVLYG